MTTAPKPKPERPEEEPPWEEPLEPMPGPRGGWIGTMACGSR